MIPVKLTLEGIYSYRSATTIDFSRLCEARLFGIFGPVGSGKSAILEAITFALYGKTERLNSKEGRNYNMMNLKSSRLWIDFEFKAGADGEQHYKFSVAMNRSRVNFTDVGTASRSASIWNGKEWKSLDHTDGEMVLGINYNNFIKTVIIPQGRFQDFLGMSATDRTRMMKELFELQRFDLAKPTDALLKSNKTQLDEVMGKLAEKPEVPQAEIDQREANLIALDDQLSAVDAGLKAMQSQMESLKNLKSLIGELQEILDFLELLEGDEESFLLREMVLLRHRDAQMYFKELMGQEKVAQGELMDSSLGKKKTEERLVLKKLEQAKAEEAFAQAKLRHDGRDDLKQRMLEMQDMGKMRELEVQQEKVKLRLEKGSEMVKDKEAKLESLRLEIAKQQSALEELSAKQIDLFALNARRQWLLERQNLRQSLEKAQGLLSKAQEVEVQASDAIQAILPQGSIHPDMREPQLRESRLALEQRRDHLRTHLRLAEFAAQLNAGEGCPLCGSTEHPAPMQGAEQESAIKDLDAEIKGIDNQLLIQQRLRTDLQTAQVRLEERKAGTLAARNECTLAQQKLEAQPQDQSPQAGLELEQVATLLAEAEALATAQAEARKAVDHTRKEIEAAEKEMKVYQEGMQKLAQEIAGFSGQLTAFSGKITVFDYAKHRHHPVEEFVAKADRFKEEVEQIDRAYDNADKLRNQLRDEVGSLETGLKLAEQKETHSRTRLTELDGQISARLIERNFANRAAVQEELDRRLNISKEEEEIKSFKESLAAKRGEYQTKSQQVGERTYDKAAHEQLIAQEAKWKEEISTLTESRGRLTHELKQLREQQTRHRELAERHEALSHRAHDLETLASLFRADGFVNYVSKVYLRELCQRANQRFQALTRNRLVLEVSEDNAFLVRDMVNGGQTRSVKTLSGGQTFQAALSLALALADNVQMRTQSEHNFFFLDEGFGSLDRESLQVVFDTLKALRRENRIVGVISHVEDLQQEIDTHLRIRLDDETGSQIST